jgi:hypothetical protein
MWGEVTLEKGNQREAQLKADKRFFGSAIDKGAQVVRHYNTKESTEVILRRIVGKRPVLLRIQEEIVDQGLSLNATSAGGVLYQDLKALEAKYEKEKEEMRLQLERMAADAVAREELLEDIKDREKETKRLCGDMAMLKQDIAPKLEKKQGWKGAAAGEEVQGTRRAEETPVRWWVYLWNRIRNISGERQ